ncbi:MAG TPA: SMP-30/gluconolactonase/LRE family protein [Flavisolibacter sp.]|nr:SMP-30/gluconolactonase/LRE family protein [Flavisolibacter sp.]
MDTSLFKPGASPRLISRQFSFTEGPATDREGNVFFTDQPNNTIWKYGTDGKLQLFMDSAGRANGLYFDAAGNLVACADEENQLWQIDKAGKVTVLLKDHKRKRLNGPNDVWVHPNGDLYFTDPYYQRPYWTRKAPDLEAQDVYYLPKGKAEAVVAVKGLKQPNGIIGTPDGKWLYVADIADNKTYRYAIKKDGSLGEGALFVAMGSDGMTLDERGNLYLTGKGVTVFNSSGQQIAQIPVPEKWTANITFGGRQRNQLFITASQAFYVLDMNVKGAK